MSEHHSRAYNYRNTIYTVFSCLCLLLDSLKGTARHSRLVEADDSGQSD